MIQPAPRNIETKTLNDMVSTIEDTINAILALPQIALRDIHRERLDLLVERTINATFALPSVENMDTDLLLEYIVELRRKLREEVNND